MSTSVKMRNEDKVRLNRIQGRIALTTGQRMSQEELLARLLDLAEGNEERLAGEISGSMMSPSALRILVKLPVRTGIVTREEEIDDVLYGGEP